MKNHKHILIVLGCASKRDGKPSECMIARLRKAIQLYRKNNYSLIILSGGVTRRGCPPEAAVMRVMIINYLPDGRVLTETKSKTTVQNALFCWERIKDKDVKSVTVLTSKMNLRRTEHIFRKLYAHMKVTLRFEAAEDTADPVERSYYYIRELIATAYYKIFGIR